MYAPNKQDREKEGDIGNITESYRPWMRSWGTWRKPRKSGTSSVVLKGVEFGVEKNLMRAHAVELKRRPLVRSLFVVLFYW